MFKPVCFILLLYYNVIVTIQQPTKTPLQQLPTPEKGYHNTTSTSRDTYTFTLTWHPVQSDPANPILGFKVKVWLLERTKTYYSLVLVEDELVMKDYKDIDYGKLGKEDYDPIIDQDVPEPGSTKTRIEGLKVDVNYLIRVQAYSAEGEGPLSNPFTIKVDPASIITDSSDTRPSIKAKKEFISHSNK